MAKTNQNNILRLLPLVAGTLGGILLLVNRFLTTEITDFQARSDALGIIESALLILISLIWQQIQPRSPESVTLVGEEVFELAPELPDLVKTELAWASHLLLSNTVTRSLVVYFQDRVFITTRYSSCQLRSQTRSNSAKSPKPEKTSLSS